MVHRVVLCFKEDGTVSTDASGFHGGECTKAVDKLLEGLNGKVVCRTFKPEYKVVAENAIKIKESDS